MNHHFQTLKTYYKAHKNDFTIGIGVTAALIVLAGSIFLVISNIDRPAKIIYQPAKACDLFMLTEAKDLLGDSAVTSRNGKLTQVGNTATSSCGYANGEPDKNTMIVAAINVRSGINDEGVQQNKTEFKGSFSRSNVEAVAGLGESAFFDYELGQLNVLSNRKWIIISYGVGSDPQGNSLDQAIELARKVL